MLLLQLVSYIVIIGGLFVLFANCRNYLYSKKTYVKNQQIQRRITDNMNNVIVILNYSRENYADYVYLTISAKIKYLTKRISTMNLNYQDIFFDKLYKMSYETIDRLKNDFYNVKSITAPLNNINNEINKILEN